MSNSLHECSIPLVLKKIGKEKLSGCLTVTVEGGTRQLFFEHGVMRFARTDDPDFRLGALLIATGSISATDLGLFDPVLQIRNKEKVGKVLTELGLISTPILHRALITQMVRIVADLFPRSSGQWVFSAQFPELTEDQRLQVEMSTLMMEGVKAIKDFSYYKKTFALLCAKPSESMDAGNSLILTPVQRSFMAKLGRFFPTPNHEMATRIKMEEELYWRAVLLFYLLGRIDFVENSSPDVQYDLEETLVIKLSSIENQLHKKQEEIAPSIHPLLQKKSADGQTDFSQGREKEPEMEQIREMIVHEVSHEQSIQNKIEEETDPQRCFELAEIEFAKRNYFKTVTLIEASLRKGPARAKYFQLLGRAQMQLPQLRREAENSFTKMAQMEPWNADPYYYLGELYQLEGLSQKAEKQFQKALELNMDHTKAGMRMNQLFPAWAKSISGHKKSK